LFARVTTYELAETGRSPEAIKAFGPAIERIRGLGGLTEAYFFVEPDGHHAISITLWDSVEAVERSRVAATAARTDAARAAGAEVVSTYELEVGIHAEGLATMLEGVGTT
jgi:hypothetical protein